MLTGSLAQAADFRRLLATPPCGRSTHFALHHVLAAPTRPRFQAVRAPTSELSTASGEVIPSVVDESPPGTWLGCLVPKRHARRAVTRNTLKRQMRAIARLHAPALPRGLWLVRLRSPFAPAQFPSADSSALRRTARQELDALFDRATRERGA